MRAALALGIAVAVAATLPTAATAASGDVRVAIAVPITVPVQTEPLITAADLEQYTGSVGLLTRQLDAVAGLPVTLAVDPLIIVSIRVLGTDAPASSRAWLQRLAGLSNDVVALPFADSDLTLATQAGRTSPLVPEPLDYAIDPARFAEVVDEEPTPSPTPSADDVPTLPTNDDLFAWDWAVDGLAWPRENTVVSSDLAAIAAGGSDAVLLASGNVDRGDDRRAVVTVGGLTAVVAEESVSAALQSAAAGQGSVGDLVSAITAAAAAQSGSPTVVAVMDRRLPSNAPRLTEVITALAATTGVTLVGLPSVLDEQPEAATLVDRPQDAASVEVVAGLLTAEDAEARFATIGADPLRLTSERRLELLGLVAQGWARPSGPWTTATDEFLARSIEIRESVQIVETSGFNLLADSAALPIAVSNDLGQAVTVFITVRPDTGILAIGDSRVELVIEPNSQARGNVPVSAISNGTVTIEISLTGASGVQVGRTKTAEINVQAGWETPIVVVLAALLVLVFGVGIVRNIVRRRRPAAEPTDV